MRRRRPGDGDGRRAAALNSREIAAEWGLALGEPFALAHYSFAAPAGADAVLKLVPPEDDESDEEADALTLWDGDGAVRLLRHDRARRALLLERAAPGDDLGGVPEEEAAAIAVGVARRLWRPAGAPFRWIGDWVPLPCRLRVEHLETRLAAFVAAGLDEERIRKWTVIRGAHLQPQEADALRALV